MGLRPDLLDAFEEQLDEEDARLIGIDHDEEGTAVAFFTLAAWDEGAWLRTLPGRFGCGLAPAPRRSCAEISTRDRRLHGEGEK